MELSRVHSGVDTETHNRRPAKISSTSETENNLENLNFVIYVSAFVCHSIFILYASQKAQLTRLKLCYF